MLTQSFFEGKTVEELANALLGCELIHELPEGITAGIIVETESYHETDEASHTFQGKTKRNEVMFGPPGQIYIYFTYGMHHCFNVTAEEEGVGAAVLLRALEPTQGIDLMKQRRGKENIYDLCSGPAKLVQALSITKADYGKPVFAGKFRLNPREEAPNLSIRSGPRIGINRAKDKPWRFSLKGNKFVSR